MGDPTWPTTLTDEETSRLRRWHEDAYRMARDEAGPEDGPGQVFDYLGRRFHVPPQVQPITGVSHLLGEAVLREVRDEDRVLDMGTGCGVNAVLAASRARHVLAVDVNPVAVSSAHANAERNGVANRVEVRESDVFAGLRDTDGPFDLVVFDPPFRWFTPRDLLEQATADPGYRALTTFFREVRSHLADGARLLLFFGSSGDLGYLRQLVAEQGFADETVARTVRRREGVAVEYLTLRLS